MFEQQIAELVNQMEKATANFGATQEKVEQSTGSARSKNRLVSASVDARGKLTALTFHSSAYRSMAQAELAALVMETVREAQAEAESQVRAAVGAGFPAALPSLGGSSGSGFLQKMAAMVANPAATPDDIFAIFQPADQPALTDPAPAKKPTPTTLAEAKPALTKPVQAKTEPAKDDDGGWTGDRKAAKSAKPVRVSRRAKG